MMPVLSSNTQAILLLTAPLIVGRSFVEPELLTPGEYKRLAQRLHEIQCEPADFLAERSSECLSACEIVVDPNRLRKLLDRGFQLSQAVERWQTRAIWVVSRADAEYPQRFKERLRAQSPAVLYGCGNFGLLNQGGLAVVGSRHVDETLFDYTMAVGQFVARADKVVISGGAKGIDQAAMRGALEAGGRVCGVLADGLEKQAMTRDHRNMVLDGQLTLVSPYDPNAGFNVGHAMQRNKLIYALADASLVVSSDVDKGGTWAGAVEQLEKFRFGTVFVRSTGDPSNGLERLRAKGAQPWPNPASIGALEATLTSSTDALGQCALFSPEPSSSTTALEAASPSSELATVGQSLGVAASQQAEQIIPNQADAAAVPKDSVVDNGSSQPITIDKTPAETLFNVAQNAIERLLSRPMRHAEVAQALQIDSKQAKEWLDRLVIAGVLETGRRPVVYKLKQQQLL